MLWATKPIYQTNTSYHTPKMYQMDVYPRTTSAAFLHG